MLIPLGFVVLTRVIGFVVFLLGVPLALPLGVAQQSPFPLAPLAGVAGGIMGAALGAATVRTTASRSPRTCPPRGAALA